MSRRSTVKAHGPPRHTEALSTSPGLLRALLPRPIREVCQQEDTTDCDSEWQRVIFSDESRFSLGGDAQRVRVWRHRGQHQDERSGSLSYSGEQRNNRSALRLAARRTPPISRGRLNPIGGSKDSGPAYQHLQEIDGSEREMEPGRVNTMKSDGALHQDSFHNMQASHSSRSWGGHLDQGSSRNHCSSIAGKCSPAPYRPCSIPIIPSVHSHQDEASCMQTATTAGSGQPQKKEASHLLEEAQEQLRALTHANRKPEDGMFPIPQGARETVCILLANGGGSDASNKYIISHMGTRDFGGIFKVPFLPFNSLLNLLKDRNGVVPDCHGVTQNGRGSSSVMSPALVSVEATNESVCEGTVVSTKMNGSMRTWCHATSTPTTKSSGTGVPPPLPHHLQELCEDIQAAWDGLSQDTIRNLYSSIPRRLACWFGLNAGLHVQGPSSPLVVQLGDTLLLPCFSQSPLPLKDLQVEWTKTDSEALVIVFQQGESRPHLQSQSFRDRVHLFPEEIHKGNFSISLNDVVSTDAGVYRCRVSTTQASSETEVELNIEHLVVKGSDHAISASVGDEVTLNCSVDSNVPVTIIEEVSWRKRGRERGQDVLVLLFQSSEALSDSSHGSYHGRAEFFISEIPKGNFSLRLKDVKLEDQGEFICEVHTNDRSAHTTVVLQKLGFSTYQILIFVLCYIALQLSVVLGVPVFYLLKRKGSRIEIVTCLLVSTLRPLMLMKTFPYLNKFPKHLAAAVQALAVPVYHSILTVTVCSIFSRNVGQEYKGSERILELLVVLEGVCLFGATVLAGYASRVHSTVVQQMCNAALLGFFLILQSEEDFHESIQLPLVLCPLIMGIMVVLTLQRHCFQGKPFRCHHIVLSSLIVTIFSLTELGAYGLISFATNDFTTTLMLPVEAVIHVVAWLSVVFLMRWRRTHQQQCCFVQRGLGYLCCTVVVAVLIIAFGAACVHYVNVHRKNNEDCGGYMAMSALIHVLATTTLFKHPKNLPDLPHILIYMFGAVGPNIVSSITLITELSLKAANGAPTIEDLRVIVLSSETVFVSAWLALQVYNLWMEIRHRIKDNFEDQNEAGPQDPQEMEVLSAPERRASDPSEAGGFLLVLHFKSDLCETSVEHVDESILKAFMGLMGKWHGPVGNVLWTTSCGQRPMGNVLWATSYGQRPMGSIL
ncbi:hypothetical protein NFI96_034125 [Prochilodus magdalenae]|nr:hypothetical protein NFI96_034125 [Prochilodus magdalenae]